MLGNHGIVVDGLSSGGYERDEIVDFLSEELDICDLEEEELFNILGQAQAASVLERW